LIVLASASPRRRTLLEQAGLRFDVDPADVDETCETTAPAEEVALVLAERKALAVAARHAPDVWVVGADTVVALGASDTDGGKLLGKPASIEDAREMLRALSETRHRVVTGVSVVRGGSRGALSAYETTWVTMRAIADAEIEAYAVSGEWEGKAGGYATQESADAFVTRLEGGFDNVVGLPVALTLGLLRSAGAVLPTVAREGLRG